MNRFNKLIGAASLAALAAGLTIPSCGGNDEDAGLIVVSVTAPAALTDVASMQVKVGALARTFAVGGQLSPNPLFVGLYTPTTLTGRQRVSVEAPPAGCPRWAGEADVDVPAAGASVDVSVTLAAVPCSMTGTGGAGGGAQGGAGGGAQGGAGGGAQGGAGGTAGAGGQAGAAQGGSGGGGTGGIAQGGSGGVPQGGSGGAAGGGAGMGGATGGAGMGGTGGVVVPADPPSLASCTEVDHIDGTCTRQGAGDWAVRSVAFAPDGSLVASGGEDGRIKLWKPTGKTLTAEGKVFTVQGDVKALAFSPDGSLLFAGHRNGGLRAYRIPAGTQYGDFTGHAGDLYVASVSPDGAHLVSGDSERRLKVWTVANRTEVKTFTLPANAWALAIAPKQSPGTLWAAIGLGDGGVVLRDLLAAGTSVAVTFSREDSVNALAFSPDGNTLAVGSDDGLTDLYDVTNRAMPTKKTPQLLSTWPQSPSGIMYAPDGRHLAVATASLTGGGAVRLFSVAPQMPVADKIPTFIPMSLAFAPDGRAVVAGQFACGKILYCKD